MTSAVLESNSIMLTRRKETATTIPAIPARDDHGLPLLRASSFSDSRSCYGD